MKSSADEMTRYEACKALAILGLYAECVLQLYFHYLITGTGSIKLDILSTIERTWSVAKVRMLTRHGQRLVVSCAG